MRRKWQAMAVDARSLQLYLHVCVFVISVLAQMRRKGRKCYIKDDVKVNSGNEVAVVGCRSDGGSTFSMLALSGE